MTRIFTYTIPKQDAGKTILDFLKARGYSHAVLVHLKKTPESILLNGIWEHMATVPSTGDTLKVILTENSSSPNIIPEYLPLDIVYEDADLLIVNKPAGMPVHPSRRHPAGTLANAVCGYFAMQNIPYTFRCINRLDRDTTGLILLAKHMLSSAILSSSVAARTVHREYLAIAEGLVPESGIIDAPIARKDFPSVERQVDFSHGECAITHYKRLSYTNHPAYENGLSLLSLHLETGRTHQIRVHMKYLCHPLIGDFLYNPATSARSCSFTAIHSAAEFSPAEKEVSPEIIKRQALHSYRLQFTHPITGCSMEFSAPLPADMLQFFPDFPDASHRIS